VGPGRNRRAGEGWRATELRLVQWMKSRHRQGSAQTPRNGERPAAMTRGRQAPTRPHPWAEPRARTRHAAGARRLQAHGRRRAGRREPARPPAARERRPRRRRLAGPGGASAGGAAVAAAVRPRGVVPSKRRHLDADARGRGERAGAGRADGRACSRRAAPRALRRARGEVCAWQGWSRVGPRRWFWTLAPRPSLVHGRRAGKNGTNGRRAKVHGCRGRWRPFTSKP
jgi:hypothetical protein